MSSTKCVVYENISQRSKFFGEIIFVLCLFCTITRILKKNYITIFHSSNSSFCIFTNYVIICCEFYFLSQKFRKANSNRCQRKFRFRLSFWLTKVGAKNNFTAIGNQLLNCRKCCYQTVFICNSTILKRYVKVTTY